MLLAGLLGVCAPNDLGTCRKRTSDPVPCTVISFHLKPPREAWRAVFTVVDGLLGVESSLLAGKSLEKNFRFAVDAQVIDSLRIRRSCVGALGELAQRSRAHRTESLLHRDESVRYCASGNWLLLFTFRLAKSKRKGTGSSRATFELAQYKRRSRTIEERPGG
jgi:hypothetical protein